MLRLPGFSILAIFSFSYLWGASFIVSNKEDAGPGSLRQAILDLNASGDSSNTITIDPGLNTIQLASDLPVITVPVEFNISDQDVLRISGNTNQYRVYGVSPELTPVPRIQVGSSSTLHLSGKIDLGTVFVSGDGKLVLDGTNTYTGGTIVNGSVDVSGTGILDPTGSVTVNAGMFSISGIESALQTIGDLMGVGGTIIIEGKTFIAGTSNDTSYAGIITGNGSFIKQGSGTLSLTGTSGYSRGTIVNEGILLGETLSLYGDIANNSSVVFDQSFSGIYGGVISGPGSVIKENVEILTFTGVNTYEGGTIIREGELALSAEGALSSTGAVAIEMDGSFDISDITHTSQTIGDLSGNGIVELGVKELMLGTSNNTTYAGVISGTGSLVKQGSGIFTLSGANTYSGGTTINAGTIALLGKGSLSSSGSIVTSDNASFDISGMTAASQTIGDLSGTGGSVVLGEKILITETSNDASYSGVISGTGGLIKQGSGVLSLRSENIYTGGTTINAGRIALLGTGSISVTGSLAINDTGCFDISQVTDTVRDVMISDLNGTGGIVLLGEKTLVVISNHDANYAGVINGKGGFGKYGSGTLTLTGASSYTGGTFINAGVLALSGDGSLASTGSIDISGISAGFDISGITASSQTIGDLAGIGGSVFLGGKKLIVGSSNNTSYSGVISGGVGDNRYSGGTFVHEGTLQGTTVSLQGDIVNNASVVLFEETNSGVYSGTLSGSGNLIKQGAGFIEFLNDSSAFAGNITINQGGLTIKGNLGGLCNVLPNTWVAGNGTLGSDAINHGVVNQGSVQPGESIGTLTVNGNYTQAASGELVIEINESRATDLLQVTGAATLDGVLHIKPEPGEYLESTVYTFLTAQTVTGQFSEAISDIPLNYTVNYFPDKAQLFILGSGVITPDNNRRIDFDHVIQPFDLDDPDIKDILGNLVVLPQNKYTKILNKLTPTQSGGFALSELENNFNVANAFFTKGADSRSCCYLDVCESTNIWVNPLGFVYSQKSRYEIGQDSIGFTSHVYGMATGIDHIFDNNWSLGFGLGYSYSQLHWKRQIGKAHANSGYLGPYIKYDCDNFYFDFLLLGAGNFYDVDRKIIFPGFSRTAHSNPTNWNFSEVALAGFKLEPCYKFFVQPEFIIDQCNVFQEGFKEIGAGSVNLSVKNKYASFLRSLLNLKFIKEWVCSSTCIVPSINVGWLRTTPLSGRHYNANFRDRAVYASNFSITSFSEVVDQLFAGAQLLISCQDRLTFSVGYDGKFGGGSKVSEVNMALHSRF